MCPGDLTLDPHALTASTLPTEPALQPTLCESLQCILEFSFFVITQFGAQLTLGGSQQP